MSELDRRPPSVPARPTFGPSALATPANAVTIARVAISPLLLWMILDSGHSWPAVVLWVLLTTSDGIDGYLARRHGTTRSGAFLDPLADKVLVLGAMVALAASGRFGWVPVVITAVRELVISLYRTKVGRDGITVPARKGGKIKVVVQELAVGFALLPLTAVDASWIALTLLWTSVAVTLVSGAQYLLDAGRLAEHQRRPRPV